MIDLCRYANYGYDQRLEAFGPKGMICAENMKPNVAVVSDASGASVYVVNNSNYYQDLVPTF